MDPKIVKYGKYAVSLALAGFLLWFSFKGIEWKDFAAGLKGCNWLLVVLSMSAGVCAFAIRGLRWRMLLLPIDPKTKRLDTYDAITIGNVSNFIFPFLGEFVRCGIVSSASHRHCGQGSQNLSYGKALGTMALERVLDLASVLFFMLLLLVFKWNDFGAFFKENVLNPVQGRFQNWIVWTCIAALAFAGMALLYAIYRLRERNKLFGKLYGMIMSLLNGFSSILRMERSWVFILQTLLIWAMYWMQIVLLSQAFPGIAQTCSFTLTDSLFIMLVGSLASFVPVPGGIGAYHYLVAAALSTIYGLPWATGIIFATLSHESQAVTMLLTGAASFLRQSISKTR